MPHNLRYANDTLLVAGNLNNLKNLNAVKKANKKVGLNLIIKKTQVM